MCFVNYNDGRATWGASDSPNGVFYMLCGAERTLGLLERKCTGFAAWRDQASLSFVSFFLSFFPFNSIILGARQVTSCMVCESLEF